MATFDWQTRAMHLSWRLSYQAAGQTTALGFEHWPAGALPYLDTNHANYIVCPSWEDAHRAPTIRTGCRAIAGAEWETKIADHAFSAVAACPPYAPPTLEDKSPYAWIMRYAARKLVPDGVLLLVLPGDAFRAKSLARAILSRFSVEAAGSLPTERGAPSQAFGFVLRLRSERPTPPRPAEIEALLSSVRDASRSFPHMAVNLPPAPGLDVTPFETSRVDPDEVVRLLGSSSLFDETVADAGRKAGQSRPPLPLRLGHVALQLATGHLDGVVGDGRHRHVVKGRVVRRTVCETEETDEGAVEVSHETIGVEISAIDASGRVFTFAGQQEEERP